MRLRAAWERTLDKLRGCVNSTTYDRWLRPIRPISIDKDEVTLGAPSDFGRQWVSKRYAGDISSLLSEHLKRDVSVRLMVDPEPARGPAETPPKVEKPVGKPQVPRPEFNEKYTFRSFVQGQSNRLALAGAKAVAQTPGKKYNPLFIYGGPGLGKTHLLHAVGQELLERKPDFRIVYMTGQHFAEGFVHSVRAGTVGEFRHLQRNVDMWLIDDVHFIAGKERTQEELFHTFNTLYETGRQIVICSDRPPRELYLMEERLRSRFECGLVADISPPDFETRAAILICKAEEEGGVLPMDVVYLMAEKIQSSVRCLEGALRRLLAESSVSGLPATVDMAEGALADFFVDENAQKPTPEMLIEAAAERFGVEPSELTGKARRSPVTNARKAAMYLCRELWSMPWKQIGALFNKDHTSAIYAHRAIGELLLKDERFQETLDSIVEQARTKRVKRRP